MKRSKQEKAEEEAERMGWVEASPEEARRLKAEWEAEKKAKVKKAKPKPAKPTPNIESVLKGLKEGQEFLSKQLTEIATDLEKKPSRDEVSSMIKAEFDRRIREAEEERKKAMEEGAKAGLTEEQIKTAKGTLESVFGRPVSPAEFGTFLGGLGQFVSAIRGGPTTSEQEFLMELGKKTLDEDIKTMGAIRRAVATQIVKIFGVPPPPTHEAVHTEKE